jgi:hypothetical protein
MITRAIRGRPNSTTNVPTIAIGAAHSIRIDEDALDLVSCIGTILCKSPLGIGSIIASWSAPPSASRNFGWRAAYPQTARFGEDNTMRAIASAGLVLGSDPRRLSNSEPRGNQYIPIGPLFPRGTGLARAVMMSKSRASDVVASK